ncbi:MAG: nucleotidyltransferase family protein [Tepidisphaeraceae bacterium]
MESSSRIAAVVLAAGLSRRMGRFKPLLPIGDKPLLARVIDSLIGAGAIGPIVVVTGHAAAQVDSILKIYSVRAVHNPAYATGGMLSSVQTGLTSLRGEADAVFIVLGDQPMVRPDTIAALASAWRSAGAGHRPRVVLPIHAGKHGHPILLSADGIDEVLALPPDHTLKNYTNRHSERTLEVEVDDPAVHDDLDTPDDYAAALERWNESQRDISVRSASCPSELKVSPVSIDRK